MTDAITQILIDWYGDPMAYELRDNSGSMFKNKDKTDGDSRPNATGSCMVAGVEYFVSAWTKKDKNGNPWQSLSFMRKDAKPAEKRETVTVADDDAPPF